ncbi:MAG: putative glycoside hydrolase [Candidatus Cloacimonetes bacterium]|nr:putative glycoside hydrolase [Candidatus Cloacimonadota bacterium]
MSNIKILFLILLILCFWNCSKKIEKENSENEKIGESFKTEKVDTIKYKETANKNKEKIKFKKKKNLKINFTRGIYLTAYTVASKYFYSILDSAEAAEINTVIFDLKNMNGTIFFSMHQKDSLTHKKSNPIISIPKVTKTLHDRNMKAVARVVMFHDQFFAENDSLLRPQKNDGSAWQESIKKKPSWLDPSNPKVQKDLLTIISEAAKQGVDEIQLDYIRFPTQGKLSEAIFNFQVEDSLFALSDSNYVAREKRDIIKDFLVKAKRICLEYNVTLTGDVFAIVAWQREIDIKNTGQDIKVMTEYLDALHPMIYSSHFFNNFGYREDIPNEPYYIVYKATKLAQKYTNKNCMVIPYIQSNSWKVNYKQEYIISQIKAIENTNANGYILWNASNKYYRTLRWIKKFNNSK